MTIIKEEERAHEEYLHAKKKWKDGKGKNWFYPAVDGAHVRLFWDKDGKPCLEYSDGGGKTISMVKAGRRLEHYAYGIEQLYDKFSNFNPMVLHEISVAMRNWPTSRPSKKVQSSEPEEEVAQTEEPV
jgi:hypothetical protein